MEIKKNIDESCEEKEVEIVQLLINSSQVDSKEITVKLERSESCF